MEQFNHKNLGEISIVKTKEDNVNYIKLILNKTNEEIGFANYKKTNVSTAWLYNIKIEEKFQGNGLGNLLMYAFENECVDKSVKYVEGKYYPTNNHAKSFYNKHNYSIDKDGYETYIYKSSLQKTDIATACKNILVEEENLLAL